MSAWPQLHRLQPDGGDVLELEVPELRISIPDAIRTVAPNTSESALAWQMPEDYGTRKTRLIFLVNFGGTPMHGGDVHAWARRQDLPKTDFRDICAVCAHFPDLHEKLRYANSRIVATRACKFDEVWRAGSINIRQAWREAAFIPFAEQHDSSTWFAFR